MWSSVVNKASHGLLGECGGPWPSFGAIGHKSRSPDALGGSPDVHLCPTQPGLSCDLPKGITLSFGLWIGWTKTRFHVSRRALRHGIVKMGIWWSVFTMYVATLFLHSHSHHNLWKWLEISPMTMVYVIYIINIGMVDGIKWGVNDHQHRAGYRGCGRQLFSLPFFSCLCWLQLVRWNRKNEPRKLVL